MFHGDSRSVGELDNHVFLALKTAPPQKVTVQCLKAFLLCRHLSWAGGNNEAAVTPAKYNLIPILISLLHISCMISCY